MREAGGNARWGRQTGIETSNFAPNQLRFRIVIASTEMRKCYRSDGDQPGRRGSRPRIDARRWRERAAAYNPEVLDGPINSDGGSTINPSRGQI